MEEINCLTPFAPLRALKLHSAFLLAYGRGMLGVWRTASRWLWNIQNTQKYIPSYTFFSETIVSTKKYFCYFHGTDNTHTTFFSSRKRTTSNTKLPTCTLRAPSHPIYPTNSGDTFLSQTGLYCEINLFVLVMLVSGKVGAHTRDNETDR